MKLQIAIAALGAYTVVAGILAGNASSAAAGTFILVSALYILSIRRRRS